jgi:MFS family permease
VTLPDGYGRRQVWLILSGLLLASFVASLDQTVVAAAMYRIGESLNEPTAQAWVTTAFLITSTVSVPLRTTIATPSAAPAGSANK